MKWGDEWMSAMRRGDFEAAWRVSDSVLAGREREERDDPSLPYHLRWVWDGSPFRDRHVLVRCYHGLGDTIQYARYLSRLRSEAASVTLEVQPKLIPLFRNFPGVDRLIPFDPAAPAPPSECDIEIMELSFVLRLGPDCVPFPYLSVTPLSVRRRAVGLCWRTGGWDEKRSAPPELFEPLTRYPCVTLVTGPTALNVLNPQGCPDEMAATAALVAGVELVITVDTMIAHLAGALGRPTWLLLPRDPDWRWGDEADDTPWYPSMRLYRQKDGTGWPELMKRVEEDLARELGGATEGRGRG